jgi:SAM-dependent methyltransferase
MAQLYFAKYRRDSRYTHYLFRYPAKFHPPVIRRLIDNYTSPKQTILDPFCGSGTLLVEALIAGRNAVGLDIDPVATFIAKVKSKPIADKKLTADFETLMNSVSRYRRSSADYDRLMFEDFSNRSFSRLANELYVPDIPNIAHWFRKYVAIDLARLRNAILEGPFSPPVRNFFLACFAGIIRNASNADPVPVSGLEVTSHMRDLDADGRRIDPFELFERRVHREIAGMKSLFTEAKSSYVRVLRGHVAHLHRKLSTEKFDVVITSPPYNTAVDYYRRHMLEMYWLGAVHSQEDRLQLAPQYVGRAQVRVGDPSQKAKFESSYVQRLIAHARQISPSQERAIVHYCASMQRALTQISAVLKPRKRAIFVVGNSKWNGRSVRATRLLIELAKPYFEVGDSFSYPARNRYMSYKRRNGADVDREYVVLLDKRQ